jgi:membrane-bound lytic murein transglycosylase F
MRTTETKRRWLGLILLVGFLVMAGGKDAPLPDDLAGLRARGELVLVTAEGAGTYHEGPHGPGGFEYDLVKAFADHLGLPLRVILVKDEAAMVAAIRAGAGDILAAGFPLSSQSSQGLLLGPGYLPVSTQVIGRRGGPPIRGKAALAEFTLWMTDGSASLESLDALHRSVPGVSWQVLSAYRPEDLLRMVWKRSLPLAVVNSHVLALNHFLYPELIVLQTLAPTGQLRWATDPRNRHLNQAIHEWFVRQTTREIIDGLVDFHYSHLEALDYVEWARFNRRVKTRLPKYRAHFEAAAGSTGLDWRLVAVQAYQESHWDPKAESYTGVRGIMMITRETAAHMGLADRMDVETSILAGTRYLAQLHHQVGRRVPEPDRTLMALAAYNIGFGHLQDARILARRLDKPDHRWHAVRAVLPLLEHERYYQTLDNGYARGSEAVIYVDRIRTFYKMLPPALDRLAAERPSTHALPAAADSQE